MARARPERSVSCSHNNGPHPSHAAVQQINTATDVDALLTYDSGVISVKSFVVEVGYVSDTLTVPWFSTLEALLEHATPSGSNLCALALRDEAMIKRPRCPARLWIQLG
jgi:alpha-D-ribose 1-methylphosphonate 5-triphosphate synthase subunit PhnL